ncbi:phosphatase PAP2 family protein [Roseburia sp. AM51-8]|nr:phosphatase PAP2 family protein [Roseburia sp. AM16-25]RHQ01482.1 phosphatase PAP2 family protein [Roseburia sp. AM51-8]
MGNVFYFDWEFDLLYWFQGLHNPVLDKIVVAITSLGNAGIFWILLTIAMLIFCKDKKVAWTSALALLFSLLVINVFLKNTVMRARPCWIDDSVTLLVKNPKDYSFPSGHSSASFASAVSIVQYARYRKQGIAAVVLAALIAISRMYVFVHFPTDVLTGTILGIIEAILAGIIVRFIYRKMEEKKTKVA